MKPDCKIKRVCKILWYRLFHATRRSHVVRSKLCNIQIIFTSVSKIGESIYSNGFERSEREIIGKILSQGDRVIDVGANVGFFSCLFAKAVGAYGRVIAVDPTPAVYAQLQENIQLNNLEDTVKCLNVALSDQPGVAMMNCFPEGNEVYNSLGARIPVDTAISKSSQIEVNVTTLGTIIKDLLPLPAGAKIFVKVDVEGYEHKVILGGLELLRDCTNCSLMIELYEPTAQQCGNSTLETVRVLQAIGYRAYAITGSGKLTEFVSDHLSQLQRGELVCPNVFFLKQTIIEHLKINKVIQ